MQDLLQRQMAWDENSTNAKNPGGLHFQFFKIDETGSSGKRTLTYRVYVRRAPEDKKYTLTVWRSPARFPAISISTPKGF